MPKPSTKVWVVTGAAGHHFADEDLALARVRELLSRGIGLADIALVEGYRREVEADIELVVHGLKVRPVGRKSEEESQ